MFFKDLTNDDTICPILSLHHLLDPNPILGQLAQLQSAQICLHLLEGSAILSSPIGALVAPLPKVRGCDSPCFRLKFEIPL